MNPDLDPYKFPPDPAGLLSDLGIQKLRLRGHKITGVCPFHLGADQDDGFFGFPFRSAGHTPGTYGCGTKQCVPPMDLIELVRKILGLDFKEALRWIGSRSGYGDQDVQVGNRIRRHLPAPRLVLRSREERINREMINRASDLYQEQPEPRFWERRPRPIAGWVADLYEAGLIRRKEGNREHGLVDVERAIFPVYDARESDTIVGWTGRITDDSLIRTSNPEPGKPIIPKWRHYPAEDKRDPTRYWFSASDHFFGWQLAGDCVRATGRAILAEGPVDVLSGFQLSDEACTDTLPLGVLGTTLKAGQAQLLRHAGAVEVWCVLDTDKPDAQGRRAGDNMIASVRREMPYATIYVLRTPEGMKDLGDVADPAAWLWMIENRILQVGGPVERA